MARTYRKTRNIKAEQFDGTKETAERLGLFRYRGGWYLETLEAELYSCCINFDFGERLIKDFKNKNIMAIE